MKKEITTLFVALCIAGTSFAQSHTADGERKLLSQYTQGSETVSRYLVKETNSDNNEFSVRYKINLTQLISTYDNNAEELKGLQNFIDKIQSDSLKKITTINVTGYASPDGPTALNERLANERAIDFRQYIDKNHNMAQYNGTTTAIAQKWNATAEAIAQSSTPNKESVLATVKSSQPQLQIEEKLKSMPQAWDYIKQNILPPMRCVELWVKYNSWTVEEVRTPITPQPTEEVEIIEDTYILIVEDNSGGMVVNPDAPLDYDNDKFKEKFKFNRKRDKLKEMQREGRSRQRFYDKQRY